MQIKQSLGVVLFFGVLAFFSNAQAQETGFREAMDSCLTELGLSQPAEGQRPSESDREKVRTCLENKGFTKSARGGENREAFEACMTETGVSRPESGSRPSEEDRAKMDACLASKGISKPQEGSRGRRGGRAMSM